jgi:hypothetical protein
MVYRKCLANVAAGVLEALGPCREAARAWWWNPPTTGLGLHRGGQLRGVLESGDQALRPAQAGQDPGDRGDQDGRPHTGAGAKWWPRSPLFPITLDIIRRCRIMGDMRTVAETAVFEKYAAEIWSEGDRQAFINWIAANHDAGDVIAGSGGCRKVRWIRGGMGKRGGARVIYFNGRDGRM